MTERVSGSSSVSAVGIDSAGHTCAVVLVSPEVPLPSIAGAAGEGEVRAFMADAAARMQPMVADFSDPGTMIMAIARMVEESGMNVNRVSTESANQAREAALRLQAEAAAKASKNEESAGFWGMFAKIAGYVAAVAGVVASIASCVVTGPAGVAGAVGIIGAIAGGLGLIGSATSDVATLTQCDGGQTAGGVLGLGASILGLVASVLSVISNPLNVLNVIGASTSIAGQGCGLTMQGLQLGGQPIPPELQWLTVGLSVGGAAMSLGSMAIGQKFPSAAAGAASRAGSQVARTTQTVAEYTRAGANIASGGTAMVSAGFSFAASNDRANAKVHGEASKRAMEAINDLVEDLRELAASVARQRGRGMEVIEGSGRAKNHLARNLYRG